MSHVTTKSNELYTTIKNGSGVVKSIHRGLYSTNSVYGQRRTNAGAFTINSSKAILILNTIDEMVNSSSPVSIISAFKSIEIADDGLYYTLNVASSQCMTVCFYWQVIEFY